MVRAVKLKVLGPFGGGTLMTGVLFELCTWENIINSTVNDMPKSITKKIK